MLAGLAIAAVKRAQHRQRGLLADRVVDQRKADAPRPTVAVGIGRHQAAGGLDDEFEANFLARGMEPPDPLVTSRSSQRELMLMRSLGALMPVPRSALREAVAEQLIPVRPVGGWRSARRVGIVRRANGYLSPAASQAVEALEVILRKER